MIEKLLKMLPLKLPFIKSFNHHFLSFFFLPLESFALESFVGSSAPNMKVG